MLHWVPATTQFSTPPVPLTAQHPKNPTAPDSSLSSVACLILVLVSVPVLVSLSLSLSLSLAPCSYPGLLCPYPCSGLPCPCLGLPIPVLVSPSLTWSPPSLPHLGLSLSLYLSWSPCPCLCPGLSSSLSWPLPLSLASGSRLSGRLGRSESLRVSDRRRPSRGSLGAKGRGGGRSRSDVDMDPSSATAVLGPARRATYVTPAPHALRQPGKSGGGCCQSHRETGSGC